MVYDKISWYCQSKNVVCYSLSFCRTKTRDMAITVRDVKMWNDVNVDSHNIKTLIYFKNNVKKHYINR